MKKKIFYLGLIATTIAITTLSYNNANSKAIINSNGKQINNNQSLPTWRQTPCPVPLQGYICDFSANGAYPICPQPGYFYNCYEK